MKCMVTENIHTHPTEGLRGWEYEKPKFVKESMKLNCNFWRGGMGRGGGSGEVYSLILS